MIDSRIQGKIDRMERIQDKIVRTIEYEYSVDIREVIDILKISYNIEKLHVRRNNV